MRVPATATLWTHPHGCRTVTVGAIVCVCLGYVDDPLSDHASTPSFLRPAQYVPPLEKLERAGSAAQRRSDFGGIDAQCRCDCIRGMLEVLGGHVKLLAASTGRECTHPPSVDSAACASPPRPYILSPTDLRSVSRRAWPWLRLSMSMFMSRVVYGR